MTIPVAERTRIPVAALEDFYHRAFMAAGLSAEGAATVARIVVGADVYGIESHGAALVRGYIRRLRIGIVNPAPRIRVVSEFPGTLVLDGDNGPGPVVGAYAMGRAIAKARESGVGTVVVRNSNHFAALANYSLMAVDAGMAGMTMTATGPGVVPLFGNAPIFGTNPICIAFPGGNSAKPFLIDMSTSVVAMGKFGVYRREGKPLPEGWAVDDQMRPTTDATAARYGVPLGGDREHGGQKGHGLSIAVDLFTGILAGGKVSAEISRADVPLQTSHHFTAWRIDAFVPGGDYRARFDEYMQLLHDCPPAPGHARVLVPGDPEWAAEDDRRAHGVPVNPQVRADLEAVAKELEIPFV